VAASVHRSKRAKLRILSRLHREQAGPHSFGTIALMALKHVSHALSCGRRVVTSQVATKGGTTEAGLKALSENHVTEILAGAVAAAVRRAREIREENDGCTR